MQFADQIKNLKKQIMEWYPAHDSKVNSWDDYLEYLEETGASYGDFNLEADQFESLFENPESANKYLVESLVIIPTNTFGSECDFEVIATNGLKKIKDIWDESGQVVVKVFKRTHLQACFVCIEAAEGPIFYRF